MGAGFPEVLMAPLLLPSHFIRDLHIQSVGL